MSGKDANKVNRNDGVMYDFGSATWGEFRYPYDDDEFIDNLYSNGIDSGEAIDDIERIMQKNGEENPFEFIDVKTLIMLMNREREMYGVNDVLVICESGFEDLIAENLRKAGKIHKELELVNGDVDMDRYDVVVVCGEHKDRVAVDWFYEYIDEVSLERSVEKLKGEIVKLRGQYKL